MIVSRVTQVVQEKQKSIPLHVAKYPVALDELIQDFESYCWKTSGIVGIFGIGGSGKTTLAKELFNRKRLSYNAACFLSDVRESHARGELHRLQIQLLKDIFPKDSEIGRREIRSMHDGTGKLKNYLERAKHLHFLIILDDVDHQDQLDALLPGGVFGFGSLAIITTRDQSVLRGTDIRYKIKGMNKDHAKELFCSHAFRIMGCKHPPPGYERLVQSFVEYCQDLPLALKVLGAHLYGRNKHFWKLELEKVNKIQPKDIMQRLKISFDGLDTEEKQIFMDIACFFNKKEVYRLKIKAIKIWKVSGWSAKHALQTLQDKCLVELVVKGIYKVFEMHDHIRDLGRQIADKLCPLFPHELGPPRLWRPEVLRSMEAKGFEGILANTKGRCFHSFKDSSLQRKITYFIADIDLLWLEIEGNREELIRIPSWIPLLKLHLLEVWDVKELWSSFQQQLQINSQANLEVRKLWILRSPSLQKLPCSMEMFNHLEELDIYDELEETDTTSLVQSLKQLSSLRSLVLRFEHLGRFREMKEVRGSINLDSSTGSCMGNLETIRIDDIQIISKLLISGEMCPRLRSLAVLYLKNLNEMELHRLESLTTLVLDNCSKLKTISGLSSLTRLRLFKVKHCAGLKSLPSLSHLHHLKEIRILHCPELQSVEGVEQLPRLKCLVIQMPANGNAWVRSYIYGLKTLSVEKTILTQKAMSTTWSNLNGNLFSEVIEAQAVSQIVTQGKRRLKIKSSSSAITIYALLVTSEYASLTFESEVICSIPDNRKMLITFLLAHHDSKGSLENMTINRGFKATVKVGEEGKALTVLRRIVDRLYIHNQVPN